MLARAEVHATVFTSACLAELAPDTLSALSGEGHEIAAHGYSQHIIPALLDVEDERAEVERCVRLLSAATGSPPSGWLSPRGTPSPNTADIVASHGMEWFSDVFDEDEPYRLSTPSGDIAAIPFKMEVNDLPLHMRHGQTPRTFVDVFEDTFRAMYEAGGDGCFLDVTVHAHVFGRPHGAWTIEAIADHIAEYPDVGVHTRRDLARWTMRQKASS